MPVTESLEFREIREFGTLWTRDNNGPPNAAQLMSGCQPLPGGGLRAAIYFKGLNPTGLTLTDWPIALMGGLSPTNRLLLTMNKTTGVAVIYHQSGTADWAFRYVFNNAWAVPTYAPASAHTYYSGRAGRDIIFTVHGAAPDAGLWSVDQTAVTRTLELALAPNGPLTTHQARLLRTNQARLLWTDPGAVGAVWPAANFLDVEPQGATIDWIVALVPVPPSDLFVIKNSGQTILVQGDLSSPVLRVLNSLPEITNPIGSAVRTPYGIAALVPRYGVYLLQGDSWTHLSEPLAFNAFDGGFNDSDESQGNLLFFNDILYCPAGLAYDFRTKAWHLVGGEGAIGAIKYYARSRTASGTNSGPLTAVVDVGSTFGLREAVVLEDYPTGVTYRDTNYEWQSMPLRDPTGRQVEVREIQVICRTFDNGSQIHARVHNGASVITRSVTLTDAGVNAPRFFFRERGREPHIAVQAVSAGSTTEAPTIEAIRIGTRARHLQ